MGWKKPKMSPLVSERNWSYQYELRVAEFIDKEMNVYIHICMYIQMHTYVHKNFLALSIKKSWKL